MNHNALELRDMAGRAVWTSEVGGFTVELPTTAIGASGVYVLTARDASGTLQQTITAVH